MFAGSGDISKDSTVRMMLEPSVWDLGPSLVGHPPGPRRVPPTHGVLGQLLSCPVASYTLHLFVACSRPSPLPVTWPPLEREHSMGTGLCFVHHCIPTAQHGDGIQ